MPLQVIPRRVLRRITASGSATVTCRGATVTCRWPALTRRARVRSAAGGRGQRGAARPPVRRCPLPSARYQLISVGPHTAASCDARVLSRARLARLEPRWKALSILMELARKRLPQRAVAHLRLVSRYEEARGASTLSRAARAANPMDVRVKVGLGRGQVELNDVCDAGHVDPSRGHVRGDQYVGLSLAEPTERGLALPL